jgi:polyhydroxyalkanoate synthase
MSESVKPLVLGPHPAEFVSTLNRLSQQLMRLWASGNSYAKAGGEAAVSDPLQLGDALTQFSSSLLAHPTRLLDGQMQLWWGYTALAQQAFQRLLGLETESVIDPERGDYRFRDSAWDDNAVFDLIKQSYLLSARAIVGLITASEDLDERTRAKLEFFVRQVTDALSPSNFAATNPQVWRAALESGGKNLLDGLSNMLDDLEENDGRFNIKMTDMEAFVVGENIAVTPGKVVFQNELMQLIQYAPTTEQVKRRPLLIMPPWMNKYYVLDLRPGNSFVQWLVDQGHTVFIISWVNPDERLADKSFEDYMVDGPLAALDAIEQATGEPEVNVVGYCLGGILLAATMAWMTAKKDKRVKSATYFNTMVDFSDTGEISLFIDEEGLESLEGGIEKKGYLSGRQVADTFRVMRANDLVWSFFVNSYLLGKGPRPFDILYWNSDSTNMPAAMHTFFMRNMYLDNRMREPGGVTMAGVPIDVTSVKTPAYIVGTREDHIAPWKTAYETTQLFSGPTKFVLGASGHIAGIVNPPQKQKYGYWTNSRKPADPEAWLAGATEHAGSWWPDWITWVNRYGGGTVPARTPGAGDLTPIEDAPGSYVRVRIS